MAAKTCPACRERINVRAIKCPHCHSTFNGVEMEAGNREARRSFWIRAAIALAVLLLGWFALLDWLQQPETMDWLVRVG